jgi:hypothetical protein
MTEDACVLVSEVDHRPTLIAHEMLWLKLDLLAIDGLNLRVNSDSVDAHIPEISAQSIASS